MAGDQATAPDPQATAPNPQATTPDLQPTPPDSNADAALTPAEVLAAIPHGAPFRFVEDILEIDNEHIVASCRFDESSDFYRGHFPGNPITPGVLLLEAMAQAGVVAHGIYLLGRAALESEGEVLTLFTHADAEFLGVVRPGERLLVRGQMLRFRHRMMRSKVSMHREDGSVVCEATLTGLGVKSGTDPDSSRRSLQQATTAHGKSGSVPDFGEAR